MIKNVTIVFFIWCWWLPQTFAQSQPGQPASGPGGSDYSHAGVKTTHLGSGVKECWIFEPDNPKPDSADVVVFNHGYLATNSLLYGGWINHFVRKGYIVIFPRYQTSGTDPLNKYTEDAATAIRNALDTLNHPGHVAPILSHFAVMGHSMGGVISANLAILSASYGLPPVKALFSCQPGAGGLPGIVMSSYEYIPANVKTLVVVGKDDFFVEDTVGRLIFNTAIHTPQRNLVTHFADNHGSPAITAAHWEPLYIDSNYNNGLSDIVQVGFALFNAKDAVDYYCLWKLSEALIRCAFDGQYCDYALGNTANQRSMGNWSDGTPVVELQVEVPDSSTSIRNVENDFSIKVYPNPAKQTINISSDKILNDVTISIFNFSGKKIFETDYGSQQDLLRIDLADIQLKSGIYLIDITSAEQRTISKLIIAEE